MLASYEVKDRIGSGGIGVVYRAEDRTLRRAVALKFLSDESLAKRQIRVRFLREARLAASLNHPNICTIHEVGEAMPGEELVLEGGPVISIGTPFIVMELVEGRSLDAILDETGPMRLEELLKIAVQIVEGMVEAHSKGVVHRDLKPKNIMVTSSGRIKMLDFGLAKPLFPAAEDDNMMKAMESLSTELTREGMVVGTVTYMSPEQAQGHAVDARSDIFSFGAMIYEMATGKKPFQGDSATSTIAKILESEPELLTTHRGDLPPELVRIIHRCLRKKPEDRYHDTRDLSTGLKDLLQEISSGAVRRALPTEDGESVTSGVHAMMRTGLAARVATWAVAAAAVVVIALAAAYFIPRLGANRGDFIPPSFKQMTFTGSASFPAISPDGQYLAYVTELARGGQAVIVQDMTGGQQLEVLEAKSIRSLRWAPNGSQLLVSASTPSGQVQTMLVPRLGGTPRALRYYPFIAWSPDGTRFAGTSLPSKQIWFTEISTGNSTSIALPASFVWIYELDWSPIGNILAFRTSNEKDDHAIWTTSPDGNNQQVVVQRAGALYSPRFSPAGDSIYYLADREQTRELWKVPIDPASGEARGEPTLLLPGLQAGDQIAVSDDGKQLVYTRAMSHSNLSLLEKEVTTGSYRNIALTKGTLRNGTPSFSPDGEQVAFARGGSAKKNIFVLSTDDGRLRQLTFLDSDNWHPVWSPNGNEIAFGSAQSGAPQVWTVGSQGGNPRPLEKTSLSRDLAWAPGGKILYQRPGNSNFHFFDPQTEAETALLDDSAGAALSVDLMSFFSWMASPEYSPDGSGVAINCNCPEGAGIYVISRADSNRRLIYKDSEALPVGWSADGSSIYVFKPAQRELVEVPAAGGAAQPLLSLPFDRINALDITADADRIVCSVPESQADAWLIEDFDPEL